MELQCPQCGKWMAVSQEELVIHDCQVVCPQCLAVCSYEGGVLTVRDDSDAPYRHTASVETSVKEASRFCHSCGKQIPEGISFCPYCGADLKAPFSAPRPAPVIEPSAPEPVKEKPQPVKQESKPVVEPRAAKPERQQEPTSAVEDKLRTVSRNYNTVHPHLYQNGTMPGTVFKVIAYIIILALLALLVYIIHAGLSIQPTM